MVGFNVIEFECLGMNVGVFIDNDESEISLYIGFIYKLNDDLNLYVSYLDIY